MRQKEFLCVDCPICEQFDYRQQLAQDYGDFQYWHCSCPKVGEEFFLAGYCGDAFAAKEAPKSNNPRKTGRGYRRSMDKRLDRERRCLESRIIIDGGRRKKYFKRASNKAVRRAKTVPAKGNGYRKVFDYWWTII